MTTMNESIIEDAALAWFGELGRAISHRPYTDPSEPPAERDSFDDAVLVGDMPT